MAKGLLHRVLRDYPFKPFSATVIGLKDGEEVTKNIHREGVTPNSHDITNLSKCHVTNVYYAEGTKTLKITGTVGSSNSSHIRQGRLGHNYSVEVVVLDVNKFDGLDEGEITQGFYPRPNINEKTIQIRCNCESYRFRFAEYNRENKASSGNFGRIGINMSGRAPNNPKRFPGECKHIRAFMNYLIQQGFVTE